MSAQEPCTADKLATGQPSGRLNQTANNQQTTQHNYNYENNNYYSHRNMSQMSAPHFRRPLVPLLIVGVLLLVSHSAMVQPYLAHALPVHQSAAGRLPSQAAYTNQSLSMRELANQLEHLSRLQHPVADFDASSHRTVLDAIKAHSNLQKFAELCDSTNIKHVMSLRTESLTVFAPVDGSLADLLAKAQSRKINLEQLAKNHVINDANEDLENPPAGLKLTSKSRLPLYVNRVQGRLHPNGAVFVNNARKLATYLIPTGVDKLYHTLHIVDEPLVGLFITETGGSRAQAQVPPSVDSIWDQAGAIYEFAERFTDLKTADFNQLEAHLHRPRVFHHTNQQQQQQQQQLQQVAKVPVTRDQLELRQLGSAVGGLPELRALFHQTRESNTPNTYFVPLDSGELSDALSQLSAASPHLLAGWAKALVLPGQALFTRTMELGRAYATAADLAPEASAKHSWLSLIKSLPERTASQLLPASSNLLLDHQQLLLEQPLIVQAGCSLSSPAASASAASSGRLPLWRAGLTNAELVLANIPLANGVLHFIRSPLFVAGSSVRELLANQELLGQVSTALGSRSATPAALSRPNKPLAVHKFRRLLELASSSNYETIAGYLNNPAMAMTILVPSDEAFARLRYDIRGLVDELEAADESSNNDKRQAHLERLIKNHFILHKPVTSEQISAAGSESLAELNGLSKELRFEVRDGGQAYVKLESSEWGDTEAHLLQQDLLTSQGVVHIIDRVLGEPEETIYSVLEWNQMKLLKQSAGDTDLASTLDQLVGSSVRQSLSSSSSSVGQQESIYPVAPGAGSSSRQQPEYQPISQSIQQFLDDTSNKPLHDTLAGSMNISFQLAQQTSGSGSSWNDKFKEPQGHYTYFIPSDLGWLRALVAHPALYRPLMSALGRGPSSPGELTPLLETTSANHIDHPQPQSQSQSQHPFNSGSPFIRILERHLVNNKRIHASELANMNSFSSADSSQVQLVETTQQPAEFIKSLTLRDTPAAGNSVQPANILQFYQTTNGYLYLVDNLLVSADDADSVSQVKPISSAFSLSMATQNFFAEYLRSWLPPFTYNANLATVLIIGLLGVSIVVLLLVALVLASTRLYRKKSNSLRELEVSASSSDADAGSPSITKNL